MEPQGTADPVIDTPSDTPVERLVIRIKLGPDSAPPAPPPQRFSLRSARWWIIGALVLLLGWAGIALLTRDSEPEPESQSPALASAPAPNDSARGEPSSSSTAAATQPSPAPAKSVDTNALVAAAATPSPVREVLPDVSQGALNTIRGTVRVSVRVTIDPEGKVLDATTQVAGPSRYFERKALEAAKQWTFTPSPSTAQRRMLLKFNFRRSGVTAEAVR